MLAGRPVHTLPECCLRSLRQSTSPRSYRLPGRGQRPISSSSTSSTASSTSSASSRKGVFAAGTAVAVLSYTLFASSDELRLDAKSSNSKFASPTSTLHSGIDQLGVFLWGTNRNKIVAPDAQPPSKSSLITGGSSSSQLVKKPRYLPALSGQSFRDLALHESYAVAVTPQGDLLQWGAGYSEEATVPTPTLKGQNIVQVALTPTKIYARTKNGNVLIVPVSRDSQLDTSNGKNLPTISFFWRILGYSNPGVHFVQMQVVDTAIGSKKIVDISAGRSHLLALTSNGKGLCAAVDSNANESGQLGGPRLLEQISSVKQEGDNDSQRASTIKTSESISEKDINYDTTLKQIPALRKLTLTQLVAGDRHSLALTSEGRVLGWGNNGLGQLALGNSYAFPTIPAPTESAFSAGYPKAIRVTCKKLFAGGDASYFLVERQDSQFNSNGDPILYTDLLAAGNGMYGGMGSGQFFSTGTPTKVKTVSGLSEYDEKIQSVRGIGIHDVSVNATHIAVILDNAVQDAVTKQSFGNDVYVFGHNADYQLGTGKRSNLAVPQHIGPMPYPLTQEVKDFIKEKKSSMGVKEEESLDSGSVTHMPHSRLQLAPRRGKLEERIVCGYGTTAVYWHTNA